MKGENGLSSYLDPKVQEFLNKPVSQAHHTSSHVQKIKDGINDETLPVIITLKQTSKVNGLSELCALENLDKQKSVLPSLKQISARCCQQTIQQLSQHPDVTGISYDLQVKALINVAASAVNARYVEEQFGLTGNGITIAVVDTGVEPHPDLVQPTNRIVGFADFINNRTTPYDDHGHGTHVAGCAAGNGRATNGLYRGAAPEANVVGVKVLDQNGSGSLSTVIEGINWVIDNQAQYNIRIMNLSLGVTPFAPYYRDPLATAAARAWQAGIFVTAAAGNDGAQGTINSPGFHPLIFTVGAIDDRNTIDRADDVPATFSSMGPTVNGLIKPDIKVPGQDIISLVASDSTLARQYPHLRVGNRYIRLSGTSMSTGLMSGMAAQILQQHPSLTPDELKVRYRSTSSFFAQGRQGYAIQTNTLILQRHLED
ncbi:S8 family peptidase [Caldalkalibacillus salinus]|uniref:S8 family peptidase n=1 Tax=Caldalkalibacillus salinus TaxID=2803787 RepID=UPI0019218E7D|nr:S8 family peptidase [Caldalkalibacillus salinus]